VHISIDKIATILSVVPEDAIRSTLVDTASVTAQLRQGGGAMGALLYDERMRNDLAASIQALQATLQMTEKIARDSQGIMVQVKETAGILHQQAQLVPEIAVKTQELIDNTNKAVDAIGHTWPVSINMPAGNSAIAPEVLSSND
jgi:hypothetical protein